MHAEQTLETRQSSVDLFADSAGVSSSSDTVAGQVVVPSGAAAGPRSCPGEAGDARPAAGAGAAWLLA